MAGLEPEFLLFYGLFWKGQKRKKAILSDGLFT
jgi:hypothetical protein